jgi:hypothetical protein
VSGLGYDSGARGVVVLGGRANAPITSYDGTLSPNNAYIAYSFTPALSGLSDLTEVGTPWTPSGAGKTVTYTSPGAGTYFAAFTRAHIYDEDADWRHAYGHFRAEQPSVSTTTIGVTAALATDAYRYDAIITIESDKVRVFDTNTSSYVISQTIDADGGFISVFWSITTPSTPGDDATVSIALSISDTPAGVTECTVFADADLLAISSSSTLGDVGIVMTDSVGGDSVVLGAAWFASARQAKVWFDAGESDCVLGRSIPVHR